jgi:hypothetical protein
MCEFGSSACRCPGSRRTASRAAALFLWWFTATAWAQAPPDLSGAWSLYHQGSKIDVGRWPQIDKNGNQFGGREVKGPYIIMQTATGLIFIYHEKTAWMVGIPKGGGVFDTRRGADGYELGPYWGNADLLELRPRGDGNEFEIWKDRDGTDQTIDFVFTEYTLMRENFTNTFSGAPPDVVL